MSRNRVESNEARICAAVMGLLTRESDEELHSITNPERDGSGPPVEQRFMLGAMRFAVEHTLIEPFEGAITSGLGFLELTESLRLRLDGTMPRPGTWSLLFPLDPTAGRHRKTHSQLRDRIEAWVRRAAADLHVEYPERRGREIDPQGYFGSRQTEIDGIALQLQCRVHWSESGKHDGTLFLTRIIGPDLEQQRLARIKRALNSKLPKLTACKQEGDTTVLVLEYSDIALTSHVSIAEALEAIWQDRDDWPDHVIIVDTTLEGQWQAFRPVISGRFSFAMDFIEIAPDTGLADGSD